MRGFINSNPRNNYYKDEIFDPKRQRDGVTTQTPRRMNNYRENSYGDLFYESDPRFESGRNFGRAMHNVFKQGFYNAPGRTEKNFQNDDNQNFQTDDRRRRKKFHLPNDSTPFCRFFAFEGRCKFGKNCHFKHQIRRVGYTEKAHDRSIICCAVAKTNDDLVELYTGSEDKTLKRWIVSSENAKGPLNISLQNITPFVTEITSCAFFNDCLFCGLKDGSIKCFHRPSGNSRDLIGHKDAVNSILSVNNTLISGCSGGDVLIWSYDKAIDSFKTIQKIATSCSILCMKAVNIVDRDSSSEQWFLWIGGSSLLIIDLQSMQEARKFPILKSYVMSLVLYENHMIVGLSSGAIKVYTMSGDETFSHNGDTITSMDGMMGCNELPILVYGTSRGCIRFLKLPQFEELSHIRAHDSNVDVTRLFSLGLQHFLTCSSDGSLCIWKLIDPE